MMDEGFNKTFVATYKGLVDKKYSSSTCGQCVLGRYPGHIGKFEFDNGVNRFYLFEHPISCLDLCEGKKYVIRNAGYLPINGSFCRLERDRIGVAQEVCKGRICYQEIVRECSEARE